MIRNLPAGAYKESACGRRLVKKEGGPAGRRHSAQQAVDRLYNLCSAACRPLLHERFEWHFAFDSRAHSVIILW